MDLQEFRKDLIEDALSTGAANGEGSCAAFVALVAGHLIEAEVLPDFLPCFYMGNGRRNRKMRVDGYALDEFDYAMNLVVADFGGRGDDTRLTRTEAEQIFEWTIRFVEEAYGPDLHRIIEVSTPAADLVDILRANKERIRKFRVLLFTDGLMSMRIDSLPVGSICGVPAEFQIWDVGRLFKVCAQSGREEIEVDFTKYSPSGIPCLEASIAATSQYRCYLCVLPGTALANVYDQYGAQLLEGNVRSFLSTKVAVNKKIRETVLSTPEMFFALNNGVSATARDVVVVDKPEGKFITFARDFQIINGGQTTASLSNARFRDRADLSSIFVQMKLTQIDADITETHELMQKISRASNSQNKVSDADFFSTHPFHIRMEQISRRLYAPAVAGAQYETHWFYERARGQYLQAQMRMTRSDRSKFLLQNPKDQLITKTDLAKVRNSWRGLPHIVSKGAQANFTEFAQWVDNEWNVSESAFNERFFQESVALFMLFKHVQKLVTHQSWYEQGYRANIVTYSIALLAHLIQKQYPKHTLDLQAIWNRQEIPQVVTDQMVVLAKAVLEAITDPQRDTVNVTEWCKRESCWTRVKALPLGLRADIQTVLVDLDEARSAQRGAKKDQRVVSGIEIQTKVVSLGAGYWQELQDFVSKKRLASPDESDALKVACQLPVKVPNAYQCQKLLSLVERATAEGWKSGAHGADRRIG